MTIDLSNCKGFETASLDEAPITSKPIERPFTGKPVAIASDRVSVEFDWPNGYDFEGHVSAIGPDGGMEIHIGKLTIKVVPQ